MAKVRWALVALMALAAVASWAYHVAGDARGPSAAEARLHCPMHPAIVADRPGPCPICGMDLVPVGNGTSAHGPTSASRSEASKPAAKQAAAIGKYWCPMHPDVASDDPGATCAKCGGMKLLPRSPETTGPPEHSGEASHGVAGLVPIDLGPERVQLIGVRTAKVAREKLSPTLRALGIVTPAESGIAVVSARFAGWIEELTVAQSGQLVRRGEVLARILSPELDGLQLTYLNAVEWLRNNRAAPELIEQGKALERQARDRLLRAGVSEADVREIARTGKPLRALSVRAPVSGHVGKKTAVAGLYVQPGSELYEIADLSNVWVVADVYEADIERVKIGQAATIAVPALPRRTFGGRVEFLYPAVSPGSRTLQARIALANPDADLRPGMYADVTLDLGALEGLVVPAQAVVDTGEVQYVFVAEDGGRFVPRRVRLGTRFEGKLELLEGPAEGERVVTTAQFLLDSESRLRAAIADRPPPTRPAEASSGSGERR